MDIILNKEAVDKCRQFAAECAPTNVGRYKQRNQSNLKRIESQIFTGKKGEMAVCQFFKEQGYPLDGEPDFEIYKGKKKSWGPDLSYGEVPIHVKSQEESMAKRFGYSWLFQLSSKRATGEDFDELLKAPDGLVVFCSVEGDRVRIQSVQEASKCIPSLLKEPVVHQLRSYKRAIYLEDLKGRFKENIISLEGLSRESSTS
jgi:hypothetical protein